MWRHIGFLCRNCKTLSSWSRLLHSRILCLVWLNSAHTRMLELWLNNTIRIISATIRPIYAHWLPVLSHTPPADLRRKHALVRKYRKIMKNHELLINSAVTNIGQNRLEPVNYRWWLREHPTMKPLITYLITGPKNIGNTTLEIHIMSCVIEKPPGFD